MLGPGFLSLLAPSEGRFASLLPSLSVGSGVIRKLLIQKRLSALDQMILTTASIFLPESREVEG